MNQRYMFYDYQQDINILANKIIDSKEKFDVVVGLTRGGLIPGVHLSHLLNLPFEALQWSSTEKHRDNITLRKRKCLVVDDIIDNGDTIHELIQEYGRATVACLIYNEENKAGVVPKYYSWKIKRTDIPDWFDFWWEVNY